MVSLHSIFDLQCQIMKKILLSSSSFRKSMWEEEERCSLSHIFLLSFLINSDMFIDSHFLFNVQEFKWKASMWYCSLLLVFFFFLTDVRSKQIPLIGIFTSETFENNSNRSSTIMIDYALHHLKTVHNLTTELFIQNHDLYGPCDMAIGTKMIFDALHRRPRPLAIFSGACQVVASAIAETAGIFDITMVRLTNQSQCHSSSSDLDHLFGDKFVVYCSREISIINPNSSRWFRA